MMDGIDTLRRGARDVRDVADRRGGEARRELSRLWSQLEDVLDRQVAPTASQAADRAGVYAREGRDVAYDLADRLSDATKARPLAAIGLAVGATLLIAALLTPRRR